MRRFLLIATSIATIGCFKGSPDVYSPQSRLSIETGGPVARVLTYGSPSPLIGQCADPRGGELLPFVCDEGMTDKLENLAIESGETLLRLPRGRFRYYSKLTSIEIAGGGKVTGAGEAKGKTAVATYSMVAEWSRYVNLSNLNVVETKDGKLTLGGSPAIQIRSLGDLDRREAVPLTGDLEGPPEGLDARPRATVFGVDLGVGVRVVLDVTVRGIDAEGAVSFGVGDLTASIVSQGAEISVRYDTVGVREDILPPGAPTNVTSLNDFVNVQRAFYGAIDEISGDWNEAYQSAYEKTEQMGTGGGSDGGTAGGRDGDFEEFDDIVKAQLMRKFQIEPAAYYIYRPNLDDEIEDTCDREAILYRMSKERWVSRLELEKVRRRCLCKEDVDPVANCGKRKSASGSAKAAAVSAEAAASSAGEAAGYAETATNAVGRNDKKRARDDAADDERAAARRAAEAKKAATKKAAEDAATNTSTPQ